MQSGTAELAPTPEGHARVSTHQPAVDTLFGFPIHRVDMAAAQSMVESALSERRNFHVVTLNPEMLMQGEHDPGLGKILKTAGLVLPDGAGVVWALKRRGIPIRRLPGIEFAENMLRWAAGMGLKVALVGATQEALELAVATLKERYPGLNLVYTHNGFFKNATQEQQVADACAEHQPQLVLVALGVPRQEKWIERYSELFQGATFIGIGGSLDVWSGRIRRAPGLMRALNLEWLYRIATEPWRLQRIYKTLPMFVVKVLVSRDPTRTTSLESK